MNEHHPNKDACPELDTEHLGGHPDREPAWLHPGLLVQPDHPGEPGRWVDATDRVAVAAVLDAGRAFAADGFYDFTPEPSDDATTIVDVARGIAEHGPAFAFWAEFHDADPDMCAAFTDHYLGSGRAPVPTSKPSCGAWRHAGVARSPRCAPRRASTSGPTARSPNSSGHEGELLIAHRDGGGVWLFAVNP